MTSVEPVLFPVLVDASTPTLAKAVAAYLARYRGQTRVHSESDLRAFLLWCRERGVAPLQASRAQIELYVRWMQEVRRFQPSTVSRRVSVVGFTAPASSTRSCLRVPDKAAHRHGKRPTTPTFREYAETCIVDRMNRPVKPLRASTAENYRKQLRLELDQTFGEMPIDQITEEDVNAWHKASSAKQHPTQTANAYLFMNSVMREAVEAKIINSNPCRVPGAKGKPAPKHEPESLSAVELRDYLGAVPVRYRVPLMVAALCGMRSGEVRGLRIRDVDPETGRITIQQGVNRIDGEYLFEKPKTKAGIRTVYAPELLRASLAAQVQARTKAANSARDRLLFTAQDGRSPLHSSVLREAHLKGRAAVDRPSLRVHDLRKTAATLAAQQGATVREIMVMLGHTTPEVAMIYQAAAEQRMKDIATRMDDVFAGVQDDQEQEEQGEAARS